MNKLGIMLKILAEVGIFVVNQLKEAQNKKEKK